MIVENAQTLSIVAGTMACNAHCPDCISRMTTNPINRKRYNFPYIDQENLKIVLKMAEHAGVGTVLITGKGEETLYPEQINDYLQLIIKHSNISQIELQTNGLLVQDSRFCNKESGWLWKWYEQGLRLISLSVVDIIEEVNRSFYTPHWNAYPNLEKTIDILHSIGYTVRLSVTMANLENGGINKPKDIDRVVEFCKKNEISQLTLRPVRKPPGDTFCPKTADWVKNHALCETENNNQVLTIAKYVTEGAEAFLQNLMHGGGVYQFRDQNVCLTDCLTHKPEESGFRQIIFYSNGSIYGDWTHPGACIMDVGQKYRLWEKGKLDKRSYLPIKGIIYQEL